MSNKTARTLKTVDVIAFDCFSCCWAARCIVRSSPLASVRDHTSVAHIEGVEPADVTKPFRPRPGFNIGLSRLTPRVTTDWSRNVKPEIPHSHRWIEIRLGSTPIRGEESIEAIVRYGDVVHAAIPKVAHKITD